MRGSPEEKEPGQTLSSRTTMHIGWWHCMILKYSFNVLYRSHRFFFFSQGLITYVAQLVSHLQCSPGCPRTHDPPSASQGLGLLVRTQYLA